MSTTIFRTIFGSRLYGTDNADSDYDVKTVFLPDPAECLCGTEGFAHKHSEFVKDSIKYDCEDIPLQKFLKMAAEGQTMAYDMLFSPKEKWLCYEGEDFGFWENLIIPERDRFISKRCMNFVSYAIGQAIKYGKKGLNLKQYEEAVRRLSAIKDKKAPVRNYTNMICNDLIRISNEIPEEPRILVGDTSFPTSCSVEILLNCYKKRASAYGERARKAMELNGQDYKALSHALRAVYEAEELVDTGKITFPLINATAIKALKEGRSNIESPAKTIMVEAKRVEQKIQDSQLPDNGGRYDDLVLSAYRHYYDLFWRLPKKREILEAGYDIGR